MKTLNQYQLTQQWHEMSNESEISLQDYQEPMFDTWLSSPKKAYLKI